MSAPVTIRIDWRGIGIQVEYHHCRWNGPCDHVELTSDGRVPLPVSKTGYKSHFLPTGIVTVDMLEQQVIAWLDVEAQAKDWKRREEDSKQLSLF